MTTAFWIASGEGYVTEARASAASFKAYNADCQTVLFGEGGGGFDRVIPLAPRQFDRWYLDSVNYFRLALAELKDDRLIYFDTDTCILSSLKGLIALIGRFDLIGAHAPARETARTVNRIPDTFPEINIGVLGIRNTPEMSAFMEAWLRQYRDYPEIYGDNDQAPLRDVLWTHPEISIYIMPPEYNCRFGFGGFAALPVKVLHSRGYPYDRAAEFLNKEAGMRAWRGKDLP